MDEQLISNQLQALSSVLLARSEIMARMGKSFGTQRDLYSALGYILNPGFSDYWWRYKRTSFGRRIIRAYPAACWKKPPQIQESQDPQETAFETAWAELVTQYKLFRVLRRLDVLAGIGIYGVLFFGFGGEPSEPLAPGEPLRYIRPFTSDAAQIDALVSDAKDPRYGLPETYKIKMIGAAGGEDTSIMVHHSRVLHVAEDIADGEVEGIPRLEAPLNDLQSLDLVVGGSGEMFWRGALPGHAFVAREGVQFPAAGTSAKSALDDQITSFLHNLKRYLTLEGVEVQSLAPNVSSPKEHFETLLASISAATGIPVRILIGSERGELSSEQDRDNWADLVDDRQRNFCETEILRPLVDKLIWAKALPTPAAPFMVFWPPLQAPSGEQQAATAKSVAEAANTFASGPAETVIPRTTFLQRYLGFTPAEVADMEPEIEEAEDEREEQRQEMMATKQPAPIPGQRPEAE